jgi:MoaA/NifB/PqqE/SkfB family radical SAM enzyme
MISWSGRNNMSNDIYSPYKATQFPDHIMALKNGWTVPPVHLNIDLSSICSQNCVFCYRNNLELGGVKRQPSAVLLPDKTIDRLIKEIPEVGIKGVELTGFYGEPTLHPKFDYFVKGLIDGGISVGVITNGDFLHKKKELYDLSYLRVSISSLKNDIHKRIRGGKRDIRDILESLENINLKRKPTTITGLGLTIDEYNYKEVYEVCELAYGIGCDNVRLTPVWKNDMNYWRRLSPLVMPQVVRAKREFGDKLFIMGPETYEKVYLGKKNYHTCNYGYFTMNITADGFCSPCCVTRGVKGWSFGNVNKQSLDEIVWGYPRRKLLKSINPNKCPTCIWDSKNEFIEYLIEGGKHAEFV